jgi:hypothetical protein
MNNIRFDLEQQLLQCWNVCDDIDAVHERVLDGPPPEMDELSNLLLGLKSLYNLKFQKCFNTFERMIAEDRQCKKLT